MVETQKDGTVTTTETTKNGVKIKTVDEPGEDVTAEITVPKSVGEAVVIISRRGLRHCGRGHGHRRGGEAVRPH